MFLWLHGQPHGMPRALPTLTNLLSSAVMHVGIACRAYGMSAVNFVVLSLGLGGVPTSCQKALPVLVQGL